VLRRKLFFNLGPLVTLLLAAGVVAIVAFQHVFQQLDQANSQASAEAVAHCRRIIIGLSLCFVIVINLAVVILLRTGSMILRPVDKLVEATRALAEGRYEFRVQLDQRDEFDELARAYNALAERLQSDQRRQMETLGQVALATNHEINNAISIIELQLRQIERGSQAAPATQRCLTQIHESLKRMTQTVQALKSIRRIVLTDYVPGVKMLDLERSQQDVEAIESSAPSPHLAGV